MVRSLSVGVTMALLFSLTACNTIGGKSESASADPLSGSGYIEPGALAPAEPRFADVPVPNGAREDIQRSYVFESSSLQIGRMVYSVKAPITEVAQFYIQRCPTYGWRLETVLQAEGAQLLFDKPDKRLHVTITDPGIAKRGVELIVHLTPKESNPLG